MRFLICGRQTQGGREYQEDSWAAVTSEGTLHLNANAMDQISSGGDTLVILSDGIGSGGHGDVASRFIVRTLAERLKSDEAVSSGDFHAAIGATDAELGRLKQEEGYGPSMGGTVVAGLFHHDALTFLSAGDSHLLRFRDDEIHYLNEKHAYGHEQGELAGLGQVTWREALLLHNRSSITSALIGQGVDICQVATRGIRPGDIYLLASDGVETIDGELLRRLVVSHHGASLSRTLDAIIEAIDEHGRHLAGGQHDNATLVMVRCDAEDETGERVATGEKAQQTEQAVMPTAPVKSQRSGRRTGLAFLLLLLVSTAVVTYLLLGNLQADIALPTDPAKPRPEAAGRFLPDSAATELQPAYPPAPEPQPQQP